MRTIVHLSDLHFGRIDYRLLGPLVGAVERAAPDVVAVSGDLTQRALPGEFREARAFLARLPGPQVVVPGNHDVPLTNFAARLLWPLENWCRYIGDDLAPFYQDEEIAVAGVNTARALVWKGGRINRGQAGRVFDRLCTLNPKVIRIVVSHHPFDLPAGHPEGDLVGRARMAMDQFARCRADIFLAGHLHVGYIAHTAERYRIHGHSALVVQAGTAISTRGRGEFNSFNVLRIAHPVVTVERVVWQLPAAGERGAFVASAGERFARGGDAWVAL